jgi:hypothetical protein
MQLELTSPQSLESKTVKDISRGLIYYVATGRNAWQSKWITQYAHGCMHTTIESAKEYAEKHRTRGTVFYIKQLPCLTFRSNGNLVIITEINNHNPLSGYSPDATIIEVAPGLKKVDGALDNYLKIGVPLDRVAMSFHPNSRFWNHRPSPKNSVTVLATNNEALSIENVKSDDFLSITSFSYGGNYHLGWNSTKSHTKTTAVLSLYRQGKSNKSKHADLQIPSLFLKKNSAKHHHSQAGV